MAEEKPAPFFVNLTSPPYEAELAACRRHPHAYAARLLELLAACPSPWALWTSRAERWEVHAPRALEAWLRTAGEAAGWAAVPCAGGAALQRPGQALGPLLWRTAALRERLQRWQASLPAAALLEQELLLQQGHRPAGAPALCLEPGQLGLRRIRPAGAHLSPAAEEHLLAVLRGSLRRQPPPVPPQPRVSVVVCAYNEAQRLPWAIRSVLAQREQAWELILVDDGSTDATREAAAPWTRDPRIRWITHRVNRGKVHALQAALAECRGRFLLELDADDWLAPDALEELCAGMDSAPEAGMATSLYGLWLRHPRSGELQFKGPRRAEWMCGADSASPLIPRLYHTGRLRAAGGWPVLQAPWHRWFEDVAVCRRMLAGHPAHFVPKLLYHRVIRQDSTSRQPEACYKEWAAQLKEGVW